MLFFWKFRHQRCPKPSVSSNPRPPPPSAPASPSRLRQIHFAVLLPWLSLHSFVFFFPHSLSLSLSGGKPPGPSRSATPRCSRAAAARRGLPSDRPPRQSACASAAQRSETVFVGFFCSPPSPVRPPLPPHSIKQQTIADEM